MKESAENIVACVIDAVVFVVVLVVISTCMIYGIIWGAFKTFCKMEVEHYENKIRSLNCGDKRHNDEL